MKKFLSIFSIALAAGLLSSCTEDFKDWALPMSNDPEVPCEVVFTAANAPEVDFNVTPETGGLIPVFIPTIKTNVEGTTTIYNCEFHNPDTQKSVKVPVNSLGEAFDDLVASAVIKLYGTASEKRVVPMTITAYSTCNGQAVVNKFETCTFTVTTAPVPVPEVWYISGTCVGNGTGSHLASACVAMFPNPTNFEELIFACKLDKASTFLIYKEEGKRYPIIGTSKDDGTIFIVNNADEAKEKGNPNPFKPELDEGYYKIVLNVKNLTISYEKLDGTYKVYTSMSIPGSWQTNQWSPGEDLMTPETTTNATRENHDWSTTVTFATDCKFKFCADGSWDSDNWGNSGFPMGTVSPGADISGTAGTYKVIFNDILKTFYFQSVE